MTTATDKGVRTVVGTWQSRVAGVFVLTIHEGSVTDHGEPYTCQCDGEIDREEHQRAVLKLADTEWTAPGTRKATDLSFKWTIIEGS